MKTIRARLKQREPVDSIAFDLKRSPRSIYRVKKEEIHTGTMGRPRRNLFEAEADLARRNLRKVRRREAAKAKAEARKILEVWMEMEEVLEVWMEMEDPDKEMEEMEIDPISF